MIVGVPTETKADERRVSLTPAGTAAFRSHGHRVVIQRGAGVASGFTDADYRGAGATIAEGAAAVWKRAEMILKVKEPQPVEYRFMHPGLIIFTYLHLAADPRLVREMAKRRVVGLGYETIELEDKSLPLARADERGRGTNRDSGWFMVSAIAQRRARRAAKRRARCALRQSRSDRRRHRGTQRMPRRGRRGRRSSASSTTIQSGCATSTTSSAVLR